MAQVHGILMMSAFGVIIPLGVFTSRYGKLWKHWFNTHRALQVRHPYYGWVRDFALRCLSSDSPAARRFCGTCNGMPRRACADTHTFPVTADHRLDRGGSGLRAGAHHAQAGGLDGGGVCGTVVRYLVLPDLPHLQAAIVNLVNCRVPPAVGSRPHRRAAASTQRLRLTVGHTSVTPNGM